MRGMCQTPMLTCALPGLIPADGEVWKARRRIVVPSLHRKYIANMVGMFGDCALHGAAALQRAHQVSHFPPLSSRITNAW